MRMERFTCPGANNNIFQKNQTLQVIILHEDWPCSEEASEGAGDDLINYKKETISKKYTAASIDLHQHVYMINHNEWSPILRMELGSLHQCQ